MPALLKIIQNQNSTIFDNKKIQKNINANSVVAGHSSAVQRIVVSIEKKIRNLEKRKNKLKQAECDLKAGKTLIEDQKKAVEQLNHVETQIELAREILRNVIQIASADETTTGNGSLNNGFKDHENCKESNDELQQLLTVQNVLHCLGKEAVRCKFLSGEEGALKLTDEQLAFLDETYHKLSPVRYIRDLRTLLDEIVACPYFDRRTRSTGSSDSGASISTLLSPGNVANESFETQQSPKNDTVTNDLEESNHIDADTAVILNAGVCDLNIGDNVADHIIRTYCDLLIVASNFLYARSKCDFDDSDGLIYENGVDNSKKNSLSLLTAELEEIHYCATREVMFEAD
uniref:Caprin-1 dimerization domain-containing protein n=1 Tax=Romanomermis culicivorax TaxID=13658 RepID=A0A915KS99_ROMCU